MDRKISVFIYVYLSFFFYNWLKFSDVEDIFQTII